MTVISRDPEGKWESRAKKEPWEWDLTLETNGLEMRASYGKDEVVRFCETEEEVTAAMRIAIKTISEHKGFEKARQFEAVMDALINLEYEIAIETKRGRSK